MGINRNIVECKFRSSFRRHSFTFVLIETLWNVNCLFLLCFYRDRYRINRNIVECKFERKIEFLNRNASINRNIVECKSRQKQLRSISGQKY